MAVLKLIENQRALWDIRSRLGEVDRRPGRCEEGGVAYGPCLLISRECGSGGTQIARMAAERLGWHVYDREIVDQISQLAHAREKLVESVDERIRSKWESTWRQMLFPEIGPDAYLHYLHEAVMTLGHHGDVVLLGRGAQHMLPPRCALRVRLVAPLEQRIKRVAEDRNISLPEAQNLVQQLDNERKAFILKFFRSDVGSPLNYDILINTSEITCEATVDIVLSSLRFKLGVVPNPQPAAERGSPTLPPRSV